MNSWKTCLAAGFIAASVAAPTTPVAAQDFGEMPEAYQDDVVAYFETRLRHPAGARVRFDRRPYRVLADLRGMNDEPCWAIDISANVRDADGRGRTGFRSYTVILYQGRPVALEKDLAEVRRV